MSQQFYQCVIEQKGWVRSTKILMFCYRKEELTSRTSDKFENDEVAPWGLVVHFWNSKQTNRQNLKQKICFSLCRYRFSWILSIRTTSLMARLKKIAKSWSWSNVSKRTWVLFIFNRTCTVHIVDWWLVTRESCICMVCYSESHNVYMNNYYKQLQAAIRNEYDR